VGGALAGVFAEDMQKGKKQFTAETQRTQRKIFFHRKGAKSARKRVFCKTGDVSLKAAGTVLVHMESSPVLKP
jgi:hypothetical protein